MPSKAPPPARPAIEKFDPWNSSATGHQRADNRLSGSTSWRESRSLKLRQQYGSGAGGGKRVSDIVGAGSLDFGRDGRTANGDWVRGAPGLRKGGQQSILESMNGATIEKNVERPAKRVKREGPSDAQPTAVTNPFTPFRKADGTIRETSWTSHESSPSHLLTPLVENHSSPSAPVEDEETVQLPPPNLFKNLVLYVNGSCGPDISDHKLKQLWVEHGGNTSISLARRAVTHVVLGRPRSSGGSGGGLAGSKIEKEISKKRGAAVKFVTADWVTESIKAGTRLPESKFSALRLAPKGVNSVASAFRPASGEDAGRGSSEPVHGR